MTDTQNHTGYSQVLKETEFENSVVIKETVYTIGQDQINQTVIEDPNGDATTETHFFGTDGHGSVRVLYDLAAAVVNESGNQQIFHFDAYGNLLNFGDGETPATNYLYSGEAFDFNIGQQYLRARFYDATTGRFNRLDPFYGNSNDPQSFHKYAYVHGDPIQHVDPTGKFAGLVSVFGAIIRRNSQTLSQGLNARRLAVSLRRGYEGYQRALKLYDRVHDTLNAVADVIDLLTFDPEDIAEFSSSLGIFDLFLSGSRRAIGLKKAHFGLPKGLTRRAAPVLQAFGASQFASERIGEFGAGLVAKTLGFENTGLRSGYRGIDAVMYNRSLDLFLVLEAKGGSGRLNKRSNPAQFSERWIDNGLNDIVNRNRSSNPEIAQKLQRAINKGSTVLTMVVNVNFKRTKQIKVGAQFHKIGDNNDLKPWRGF